MKLKLFTGIALAIALTAGLWLGFHHRSHLAEPSVTKLVKPDLAALPKPVPINAPKMKTITGRLGRGQLPALSPTASDWSAVQKIVDIYLSYEDRLLAIHSLSSHLTDADWEVLQSFLLKPDGLDRIQLGQVIKNQLLDVLCALNPPPTGLGDVLTKMYRDQKQDEVIRNYAVQHMTAYYEQMSTQRNSAKTEQAVQKTLWEAVGETSDSIGGTALLALKRLSQEYPGINQEKIATKALQMAGDNSAGELTHITAFQVCAQMGTANALPVVLEAAQNGETISTRMSAIGALGSLGGPDQIPFLNSLLQRDEERLKPAAQHALEQISTRQNQMASQK